MIVYGNPVDGFTYIGPFETMEESHEWAENNCDEWWGAELASPKNEIV